MTLSDWALVVGVPTNRDEFVIGQAYGEYALKFPTYEDYERRIVSALERYIVPLESKLHLEVLRYPDYRAAAQLMKGTRGVLVYTHSRLSMLEFRKKMVPFSDLVAEVNADFGGIADFCACKSPTLDRLFRQRAKHCVATIRMEELSGRKWLAYCARFLAEFYPGPETYWNAMLKVNYLLQGRREEGVPELPKLNDNLP